MDVYIHICKTTSYTNVASHGLSALCRPPDKVGRLFEAAREPLRELLENFHEASGRPQKVCLDLAEQNKKKTKTKTKIPAGIRYSEMGFSVVNSNGFR